jgi:hypothetical protein
MFTHILYMYVYISMCITYYLIYKLLEFNFQLFHSLHRISYETDFYKGGTISSQILKM